MKKTAYIIICLCVLLFASCNKSKKWEYKIVPIKGYSLTDGDYTNDSFDDPTPTLNKLGSEGWELVSSYPITNTVFPNFGDDKYVTGIRTNTKTTVISYVFKRETKE